MKKIETFTLPETRFLSNFYPYKKDGSCYEHQIKINYWGIDYNCTENAYQAAKTTDTSIMRHISSLSPYEAKSYWQGRENEIRQNWNEIKDKVMRDINFQKFYGHPELFKMLRATGDAILEEGNTWGDTYWGICNGQGENRLGKLLMQIRDSLPADILYRDKNGKLFRSRSSQPECDYLGVFLFPDKNLVVRQASKTMFLDEAYAYEQQHAKDDGLTWKLLEFSQGLEVSDSDRMKYINYALSVIGQPLMADISDALWGSDYFYGSFATKLSKERLTPQEKRKISLYVILTTEFNG